MNDKIPIFPLPLVLLPGEKLPLHIFEAKYKKMVEYCLKHNQKFGIVNSRNNDTLSIGCTAEITQITAAEGDTGEYDILVTGVERFIVKSYNYSKDYKQAYVKTWQDIDDSIDETLLQEKKDRLIILKRILKKAIVKIDYDDPAKVGYHNYSQFEA